MKKCINWACILLLLMLASSCNNRSSESWENVKTAGRYFNRGVQSLFGNDHESRLIASNDDFTGPYGEDYLPLNDSDLKKFLSDAAIPQPKKFPGEKGSNLPGVEQFYDPPAILASIFKNLHFETDSHVIKEKEDIVALTEMGNQMKKNPHLYLIIEGHCDERASADYNMALGMRRAQYVRVQLCKQGINPNRIYTISCGKEKPLTLGHTQDDWHQNRRAQFKLYEQK